MRFEKFVWVPLMLAAASLLSGCKEQRHSGGTTHSEKRDVGSFSEVDIRGNARLVITVGEDESLTLEGNAGLVERISTSVRGDVLHIRGRNRDWLWADGDPRVTIRITVPELESLRLRGGNDVRLAGFSGGDSRIRVEGAAHIKATGRLDELIVHMSGAGHADLSRLVAGEAKVTVDGVGSVYVNAKESLDARMNGVGAIFYSGNPSEVNTSMKGLGTIARRDESGDTKAAEPESDPELEPEPEIDPDDLQPEYEKEPAVERTEAVQLKMSSIEVA